MNEVPKYEIFISYRRDGGVDYARMIYLELKNRGYRAFFDYNSLRDGKFNEEIFKAIDKCSYFILVLSVGALDRCLSESDWVRTELEYAISKGKPIIPVCPSGSVRAFPVKMPMSLEVLRSIQISMLQTDDLFEKSFDKIVEDRFAVDFRDGRSPIQMVGGVSLRALKRIGIIVAAAVILAACIIGRAVSKNRKAVSADREMIEKVMDEKNAAWIAEEKKRVLKDVARVKADMQKITEDLKRDAEERERELAKQRERASGTSN